MVLPSVPLAPASPGSGERTSVLWGRQGTRPVEARAGFCSRGLETFVRCTCGRENGFRQSILRPVSPSVNIL